MSTRESDTLTIVAAIAGITVITVACIMLRLDETLVKLALVAISGLAGFSLAGLVRRP